MHHAFKLGDAEHNVELSRSRDAYRLHFGDVVLPVDLKTAPDGRAWLTIGERHLEVVIATRGDDVFVHVDGEAFQLKHRHPLDRLAARGHGSADDVLSAPMPGSLVAIFVSAGDTVTKGQALLVMESMKMETTLSAPRDGTVQAVHFEKAQQFDRDAVLLSLQPAGALSPSPSPAGGRGE